jgi:nitrate reductase NapE component
MNLLELNILKKIEPVYKKSFIITFLISVVIYFTIISNLFWGNHDWGNI